jgi:hypothetical protein
MGMGHAIACVDFGSISHFCGDLRIPIPMRDGVATEKWMQITASLQRHYRGQDKRPRWLISAFAGTIAS